jgi:hypothetical protein
MDLFGELSTLKATPIAWLTPLCAGKNVLAAGRFSHELLEALGAEGAAVTSKRLPVSALVGNRARAIEPKELMLEWSGEGVVLVSELAWSLELIQDPEALASIAQLAGADLILPCTLSPRSFNVAWGPGFSPSESSDGGWWRWCEAETTSMSINQIGADHALWFVCDAAPLISGWSEGRDLRVVIDGCDEVIVHPGEPIRVALPEGKANVTLSFTSMLAPRIASESDGRTLSFGLFAARLENAHGEVVLPSSQLYAQTPSDAPDKVPDILEELFWRAQLHAAGFAFVEAIASTAVGDIAYHLETSVGSVLNPQPYALETKAVLKPAMILERSWTWFRACHGRSG